MKSHETEGLSEGADWSSGDGSGGIRGSELPHRLTELSGSMTGEREAGIAQSV
jgi:hypothetical protein